jgi:hypothetical protein
MGCDQRHRGASCGCCVSSILAGVWSFACMSRKIDKPKSVACRNMRLKEGVECNKDNTNKKGNKKEYT